MSNVKDGDCFFLVWCAPLPGASDWPSRSPTKQHVTREAAMDEAQRLARAHKGRRFYVVKAISFARSPLDVETVSLDEREEMPF